MTLRRATNKYNDFSKKFYDTSYDEQQYSILYQPISTHKAPVRLENFSNYYLIRTEQTKIIEEIDPPVFIDEQYGCDHFTQSVDLNQILWEVFMGDGDVAALSLNMLRIYDTYKSKFAIVNRFGIYEYLPEGHDDDFDDEMLGVMNIFGIIGKALFKDQYITVDRLRITHERFINCWKGRSFRSVHVNWASNDVLERSNVVTRMTNNVVKQYIAEHLHDLFCWLLEPERSYGGQVMHIQNLLGYYYISRFGSPSGAYTNKIGGGTTYTLPNTKISCTNVSGYKNNTIGRSWACAELYIALLRNYDAGHNIASFFLNRELIEKESEQYLPFSSGGSGIKAGTLSRSRSTVGATPDLRKILRPRDQGRIVKIKTKDGKTIELDETLDMDKLRKLCADPLSDGEEDATNEFSAGYPPKDGVTKQNAEPIYEIPKS
ncbi:polypeptide [Nilaparvata lugens reovirus]|uniref:Polypeptide n=1 Tax=Nilaparvata lugens reovirus TaxID=33724 RepID=Q83868_9REOV|nr:polypeptide [Nilaparvata lugens reovirus]BAA03517.1 polypeptide [Nilaparvata lugens reovirus]